MLQTSLFENCRYPDAVGFRDTDTSKDAAVKVDAKKMEGLVLAVLATGDYTADEIADRLHVKPTSTRPRCTGLKAKGLIVDSEARRKNADGNNMIVWKIA